MTTTTQLRRDREIAVLSRWWPVIVVAALIVLTLSTPVGSRAADRSAERELMRAHDRLALIMADRDASAAEIKVSLEQLERSLAPLGRALRPSHPELTSAIDDDLHRALAQLGDGNLSVNDDRSEFDVAYLVPLAQSLGDARDAIADSLP